MVKLNFLFFLFLIISNISGIQIQRKENQHSTADIALENAENVVSYIDVLRTYYDIAILNVAEPTKSFDEFFDEYYEDDNDLKLFEYTVDFAMNNGVESTIIQDRLCNNYYSNSSASMRNSDSIVEDYILSSTDYGTFTPQSEFKRQPYRLIYDYSLIKKGDIVYETDTIFYDIGHTALITNMRQNSFYGTYVQTIEAVGGAGVAFGFLDDLRMAEFKIKILRVKNATTVDIESAINFCSSQLGKPYSLNPNRANTSINSSSWYCSELIYGAYYSVGVNLRLMRTPDGYEYYVGSGVYPLDLYNSCNTTLVDIPFFGFLDLSVEGKSGTTWSIKIFNNNSNVITAYYNTKMCTEPNAKNWSNLNHITSVEINPNSSVIVNISENWFAGYITVSYVNVSKRYITYANELNNSSKSLTSYHNFISA